MPTASSPLSRRARRIRRALARDTVAGALLLGATALALILANSGLAGAYTSLRDTRVGPESLHLNLTLGTWAADGLLAIFFFVVGLELKQEFVAGKLRQFRTAVVPMVAAVGGVVVPALLYTLVNMGPDGARHGWAIPAATDIAFAVAVLAVVGRFLPPALRTFLLTLAVVDDLLAISIIAIFYTDSLSWAPLAIALVPFGLFALAVQRGVRSWWVLIPLAVVVWALVHASGIHATVAGVLLGFVVPVLASDRSGVRVTTSDTSRLVGLSHHFAERWQLVSTGIAVPIFAFMSAGVTVGGLSGFTDSLTDPIALGVIVGLVVGKPLGITLTTFLMTRLPGIRRDPTVHWIDMFGMSCVAGVGFTVSLLVGELSFGAGTVADEHSKVGVLLGSLLAALLGALVLARRNRYYRRIRGSRVS